MRVIVIYWRQTSTNMTISFLKVPVLVLKTFGIQTFFRLL